MGSEDAEQAGVDEGHPYLQGMGHAGPVGVAQQLVPHVPGHLQGRHLAPGPGNP